MHNTNSKVLAVNGPFEPKVSSESIGIMACSVMRVSNATKGRVMPASVSLTTLMMAMALEAKSISTCVNTV